MERIKAILSITCAVLGQYSANSTPGTLVAIALAGPCHLEPILGLKVSNWLGPPSIHSRIIDFPSRFNSSARAINRSRQERPTAPTPAAALRQPRKPRRET